MISIIIPVFNEEKLIAELLKRMVLFCDVEIVVVDGNSDDSTLEIAKNFKCKVLSSKRGRASQMNAGANVANGNIFLFLHADCFIDKVALRSIERAVDNGCVGGGLKHVIAAKGLMYKWIALTGNMRAKLTNVFFGDQAIFVKKDVFFGLGGYDDVELFEDVIFSKKMKDYGKTCFLTDEVITVPRRWERFGIVKTTLINALVNLGFTFGVSTKSLKKVYKDIR